MFGDALTGRLLRCARNDGLIWSCFASVAMTVEMEFELRKWREELETMQ